MSFEKIGIIGGGAWGTALGQSVARAGRSALIWAYEFETITDINDHHQNRTYLPGVTLDRSVKATSKLKEIAAQDAILMVAPAQHVRGIGETLAQFLPDKLPVIICAKGIEQKTGKLMSGVLGDVLPQARLAVLSGPSFAAEVARGLPAAISLACDDEALGQDLAHALGHTTFRPYWSDDVLGTQIGGAVKNVLAIASGIVSGKELGASAHAALTTRGFGEMVRFGAALGAKTETLSGLSGLGDLLLTCSSAQSRNMSLGHALGQGRSMSDILGARKSVSEGVYTASALTAIAEIHDLDLPICQAVADIVSGTISVDEAIEGLLSRPLRAETT